MPICPRFPLFVSFLLTIAISANSSVGASAWTSYHNTRFGTTADVPKGWRAGPPPANNDGLIFTSPDGAAELTISGMLNIEDSLEAAFESYETPETRRHPVRDEGRQDLLHQTSSVLPRSDLEQHLFRISGRAQSGIRCSRCPCGEIAAARKGRSDPKLRRLARPAVL